MDLEIVLKGYVSETKSHLAVDLRYFLLQRGYGEVVVTGEDSGIFSRGMSKEEIIEIKIEDGAVGIVRDMLSSELAPQTGSLPMSLAQVPVDQEVCVQDIRGDSTQGQRLRELGLFEGRHVRMMAPGDPMICKVGECRLGICRRLACCVLVEPIQG